MKLISCDTCAVVLNADKLRFSDEREMYTAAGDFDSDRFAYDQDRHEHRPFVPCPCCKEMVFKP